MYAVRIKSNRPYRTSEKERQQRKDTYFKSVVSTGNWAPIDLVGKARKKSRCNLSKIYFTNKKGKVK